MLVLWMDFVIAHRSSVDFVCYLFSKINDSFDSHASAYNLFLQDVRQKKKLKKK